MEELCLLGRITSSIINLSKHQKMNSGKYYLKQICSLLLYNSIPTQKDVSRKKKKKISLKPINSLLCSQSNIGYYIRKV